MLCAQLPERGWITRLSSACQEFSLHFPPGKYVFCIFSDRINLRPTTLFAWAFRNLLRSDMHAAI